MDGARKILLDLQTIGVKEPMWKKQDWIRIADKSLQDHQIYLIQMAML